MTRNTAIKLLAAMAAVYRGPDVTAQQVAGMGFRYANGFALYLTDDTEIVVTKGGETVTVTADEIWAALHLDPCPTCGGSAITHGRNSPIIQGGKGEVVITK